MSKVCEFTGKTVQVGNNVSHAHNKTKCRKLPNLQKKSYFISELGCKLSFRLSTRALRTIDRCGGLVPALRKANEGSLSPKLKKLRRKVI